MGYEYEIYIWGRTGYTLYWQGDTWDEALEHMEKAAAEGCKCIKLEWRP